MHRILDWLSGRPYLLLILTMLMWGGNAVAGRLAVGEVSPMALTGLRWVVPVAVLGVALRYQLLTHRQALLERWPSILLMGTLGLTVFNALFYLAAHHTTAVNLTILQGSMPVFVESMQTRGGWLPIKVGFGLTERGRAGAEAGMACEAGSGAGARRDDRDRGRAPRAWRGGWLGGPRAQAQRGQAAHGSAPGRDGFGAGGRGGRALPLVRSLRARAGQQGPLPRDVPLPVRRRAGPGPAGARLPLPRPGQAEELRCPGPR